MADQMCVLGPDDPGLTAGRIPRPCSSGPSDVRNPDSVLRYTTQRIAYSRHNTTIADIEHMIVRTGLGDHAAFSALYVATSAKLFGVCLRILGNRTEAEDALQDVFVKIWKNAHIYRVNGYSPMTWLITLTQNLSIDRLRMRKVTTYAIDEIHNIADPGPTPEMAAVQKSQRTQIDRCLLRLDPANAAAVRGAYLDGVTYQDLADRAGVPINTMRTRLRRSLLKMRSGLTL
ncbi:sigma-70 family RNA polymerase sigma factor [Loktanella sp. DJP18]|uniref:sigma-70 family RNA polymerase sigma factor n=1 Tax=Loktanella sp. DJP18 TaxID=3409788 RepID=UPI003BB52A3E